MKIALFSPFNPQPSGVSDYTEELLPYLAEYAEIDLFVDGFELSNESVRARFRCFDYRRDPSVLNRLTDYDAAVYHMGNDHRYHAGIFDTMTRFPGVVVFHDFALQDFFLGLAREQHDANVYLDELEACHGERERIVAEAYLRHGSVPPQVAAPLTFPLNCRLAREAEAIIVHSEWSREGFRKLAPVTPIARINHHITARAAAASVSKNRHGTRGSVSIASFGLLTPDKGIERTLRALAALRDEYDFHYTLVGSCDNFPQLRELVRRYGLDGRVTITGQVCLAEFERCIGEADVAINLRERPVGATSGTLCRIMAAGVPAVVSNVGAFAELPADCVIKIDTDEYSEALLLAYLKRLLEDADLRRRIGNNARRYVVSEHSIEQSAASYIKFVRDVINRRPRKQLLDSISSELSLLGVHEANDVLMRNVAEEVATLAPLRLFESAAYFYQAEGDHGPSKTIFHDNRSEPLPESAVDAQGRLSKIEGIDYKRAAVEYPRKLDAERYHYLLTKPFYNLANKPPKHLGDGMDPETHRHFCDFANMAVALALPPGSRILDVGCGSGWLSEYFARLGYEVTGIDVSDDLIRMARERVAHVTYEVDHQTPLRCRFLAHDIESASLAEQFDAIICYDSLHHFEDEQSTMRHLAAMLPMGGLLFVLEGNKPPAGSATEEELIGVMQHYETLESPFSPEYLRQLLVVNGFALVGDYVSVNGLFPRDELEDHQLRIDLPEVNYLLCKKVAEGLPASNVPDSQIPGRLQAKITLVSEWREQVACGEVVQAALEIINIGDTLWLTGQVPRRGVVMLGVKLFDEAGTLIEEFHGQPPLPRALGPGEHAELKIRFEAPQKSGKYRMKIDLVDQQICWFEEHDSQPLILFFNVY